jgi:hypothetical protein
MRIAPRHFGGRPVHDADSPGVGVGREENVRSITESERREHLSNAIAIGLVWC